MPYVPSLQMLLDAAAAGYAVPAFNFENLEMAQGIIRAAEREQSPVILQTTPTSAAYIGLEQAYGIVFPLALRASVPVALHLDHCESFDEIVRAIMAGYSSVMIDASKLPFEENIAMTKKVVEVAHALPVTVEAELGKVGGKEDGLVVDDAACTDPGQAADFVQATGVDIFAPAIGTAHGFYQGEPKLDFERLGEIRAKIHLPLVLHGGSGIPDESVQKTIALGIAKVNFATELRHAATVAVREALKDPAVYDPKKYMGKARDAVEALCVHKIAVCGSAGKAVDF